MVGNPDYRFEVRSGDSLTAAEHAALLSLCTDAFEEDFGPFLAQFVDPVHVLGWKGDQLVTNVLWIKRWLQIGDDPLLCTAYIEAVATDVDCRNRGLASKAMRMAVENIAQESGYEIAALSPSEARFYERLGWEQWLGPLFARTRTGLSAMPDDEETMIYRLPTTPDLDLTRPISIEWREMEVW